VGRVQALARSVLTCALLEQCLEITSMIEHHQYPHTVGFNPINDPINPAEKLAIFDIPATPELGDVATAIREPFERFEGAVDLLLEPVSDIESGVNEQSVHDLLDVLRRRWRHHNS
jgi:hypothetical protein